MDLIIIKQNTMYKQITHDIRNIIPLTPTQLEFLKSQTSNKDLFAVILTLNSVVQCYESYITGDDIRK